MIELKKLRKVYGSHSGAECVALEDIDLQLPDTGLVFIIGKSGSGKSTLLNLLGGLDTITSGDVIADGNHLADFHADDFENYRSSYIGFIFQHYYLLEELTVAENIELAMSIVGKEDKSEITALLDKLGLSGFEERYPRELSGGQQQRVAIARALAKNPKLILGDELTGNLDRSTSEQILKILKEISKEKLVVIVSHNLEEADMYADRIIELHDGKIFRDRVRVESNHSDFRISDGTVYLPYFRDLNDCEVSQLESELKHGSVHNIVQLDDGFAQNDTPIESDRQVKLERKIFTKKSKRSYTGIFFKKGLATKIASILIVTLMLICASVFSTIHRIDYTDISYDATKDFVALNRVSLNAADASLFDSYLYTVWDDDIDLAKNTLGGKVYELTSVTLLAMPTSHFYTGNLHQSDMSVLLEEFYLKETYGTLICDMDFIVGEYGVNGEVNVLAGEIDPESPRLTVTDYVADSIMHFSNGKYTTYEEVVEGEVKIDAVISTGYKERYADIISKYNKKMSAEELKSLYRELSETELYRSFQNEVLYSLGITYSLNPNFKAAYRNSLLGETFFAYRMTFSKDGREFPYASTKNVNISIDKEGELPESVSSQSVRLEKGEIEIPYSTYNELFDTSYSALDYDTFVPHNITLRMYDIPTVEERTLVYEKVFTVVGIRTSTIQMHKEDYLELKEYTVYTFGLYLENNENIDDAVAALAERQMSPKTVAGNSITGMNKMMEVFIPLLKFIGGALYVFVVIYLINSAISSIKNNYFQIGVMRSFGAKSSDVGIIFVTGIILTGLAVVIVMLVFEPLIISVYNRLIVESFSMILNTYAYDITLVERSFGASLFNSALVIIITFISATIALIKLKKSKPIEIIRAKKNGGEVA